MDTDMALEAFADASKAGELDGAVSRERFDEAAHLKITEVEILSDGAAARLGKPRGLYITLESDAPLWEYSPFHAERTAAVARELKKVCGDVFRGGVMFVGLGNRRITADSVGVLAAERVLATRHLKRLAGLDTSRLAETTVLTPGVMAQTGLESSELTAAVCGKAAPSQVIVCDALACFEPSEMGRSIQISSSGISPGSGVDNSRCELSEATLGARTAAVGVPTVSRLLGERGMLVTPKPADRLAHQSAELIAAAVNALLYSDLTPEEVLSLTL